jgi:hypothetical protein
MHTPAVIHVLKALEYKRFEQMQCNHVSKEVLMPFLCGWDKLQWTSKKHMLLPVYGDSHNFDIDWFLVRAACRCTPKK